MHAQAKRCRRLAAGFDDNQVRSTLMRMADEYEVKAGPLTA
jgi:hypothetical protein